MKKHVLLCIVGLLMAASATTVAQSEGALDTQVDEMETRVHDLTTLLKALVKELTSGPAASPPRDAKAGDADGIPVPDAAPRPSPATDELSRRFWQLEHRLATLETQVQALDLKLGSLSAGVHNPLPANGHKESLPEAQPVVTDAADQPAAASADTAVDVPGHSDSPPKPEASPNSVEGVAANSDAAKSETGKEDVRPSNGQRPTPQFSGLSHKVQAMLAKHFSSTMSEMEFRLKYSLADLITSGWIVDSAGITHLNNVSERLVLTLRAEPTSVEVWQDGVLRNAGQFARSQSEAFRLAETLGR